MSYRIKPTACDGPRRSKRGPAAPRSLEIKTLDIEVAKEQDLLDALAIARQQLGNSHPLVQAALRQLRSNERHRNGPPDALGVTLLGERRWWSEERKRRDKHFRREAARKANGGSHSDEDVQAQYERQKGKCFYCGEAVGDKYHVDHVVPIVKGGSDGPENLVIACPHCNAKKSGKHPMEFCGILL